MAQTKPPLSTVMFHLSSVLIKHCWVLWFFMKPVNNFNNLSSMNYAFSLHVMILSKTAEMWDQTITDLQLSLCKLSFCPCHKSLCKLSFGTKIGLTSAVFTSSGKQTFLKDELMTFVRTSISIIVSISIIASNNPAESFPNGVAFPCHLIKESFLQLPHKRETFQTCQKLPEFSNTLMKMKSFQYII